MTTWAGKWIAWTHWTNLHHYLNVCLLDRPYELNKMLEKVNLPNRCTNHRFQIENQTTWYILPLSWTSTIVKVAKVTIKFSFNFLTENQATFFPIDVGSQWVCRFQFSFSYYQRFILMLPWLPFEKKMPAWSCLTCEFKRKDWWQIVTRVPETLYILFVPAIKKWNTKFNLIWMN